MKVQLLNKFCTEVLGSAVTRECKACYSITTLSRNARVVQIDDGVVHLSELARDACPSLKA